MQKKKKKKKKKKKTTTYSGNIFGMNLFIFKYLW